MSKYGHRPHNWFEAIINKLGGEAAAERFLRGELSVSESAKRWHEEDGIIYLTVTSNGMSGEAWIKRLEEKGFRVSDYAKSVLCSEDFKPTNGVTYEIAILKGLLLDDNSRITRNIRKKATEMKLTTPNAEVACLIRENSTDKELEAMGLLYIVTMHEPIKDSDGDLSLLGAYRYGGGRWLDVYSGYSDRGWRREVGFAFVGSRVS